MSFDDRELTARAQSGDPDAAEELAARYLGEIHAFARRWLGHAHDAEDATQETFLRAMRGLREFRGEASFRTWLYRIATRVCLDRRRAEASRPAVIPLEEWHGQKASAPAAAGGSPRLAAALAELPERQRIVLTLSVFHEMRPAEIAEVVESSVEAVKMNLSHARRRMRERLGDG